MKLYNLMATVLRWEGYIVKNGASFYVLLPIAWIRSLALDKDDKVDIELNSDGTLTLRPVPEDAAR